MKRALFTFCILVALGVYTAEAQRPTQDQLEIETLYIEAIRAKLLEDFEKAIELYRQLLEKDDENDVFYYELAKVYLKTDAPKEALDVITKAVEIEPENIWYQEELAAAHAANDDFISAAEVYTNLVKQYPNEQKFYFDLAFYYVKNNNLKDAISVFNQHESKFGVSEEVIGRKFNLYRNLNNVSKAEQELDKLVRAFPNDPNYALGLAKFYEDINNYTKAKNTYRKILKTHPSNTEAELALGRLSEGKSNIENTVVWSDPEINIDIKISKIINSISSLSSASEDKKAEIIGITKILTETHPGEAKAYAVHGDVLYNSGQTSAAIEAYEEALKYEKNIFSVWNQLLSLYLFIFDIPALFQKSEEALDYFPNEGIIYYWNGLAANYLQDYSIAMNSLVQANIMTKSSKELNDLVNAQWAISLLGLNKKDRASEKFNVLLDQNELNPSIIAEATLFNIRIGELEKATKLLERISDNNMPWQLSYVKAKLAYANSEFNLAKEILLANENAPEKAFHYLELLGDTEFQLGNIDVAVSHWKKSKDKGNPSNTLIKKIASRQI